MRLDLLLLLQGVVACSSALPDDTCCSATARSTTFGRIQACMLCPAPAAAQHSFTIVAVTDECLLVLLQHHT